MSWIKLDDQFSTNDKVLAAGKDGRELHISALCHCGRNLTDGFVDGRMVRQLAAMFEVYDWQEAVESLLSVGLWEEVENGYQIHAYLKHNPAAASVQAKRAESAERQRIWRETHRNEGGAFEDGDSDDNEVECHEESNAVSNAVSHAVTDDKLTTASRSRSHVPVPDPVPVVVPERASATTITTADPLTALFFGGLERLGVLVASQMQAEAYNDLVTRIRGHPQAEAFMAQLMTEAAATTSGRITPRWFEVVTERCLREGRLPGARGPGAQSSRSRDAPARNAAAVDWDAVQRLAEGRDG
jgi:hypothetical protein